MNTMNKSHDYEPTIYLLSGFTKSGKDAFADYLVRDLYMKRLAFADPLKRLTSKITGLDLSFFYDKKDIILTDKDIHNTIHDTNKSFIGKRPRDLLLEVGRQERLKDEFVFITPIINVIKESILKKDHSNFVITDLRRKLELDTFKNEFPYCKTIWINRPGIKESDDGTIIRSHNCDISVINDRSIVVSVHKDKQGHDIPIFAIDGDYVLNQIVKQETAEVFIEMKTAFNAFGGYESLNKKK